MSDVDFDAIVMGAGPAGVSAALDLVAGGARVALLDRSPFPREKACAGVLSEGTIRLLNYDASAVFREMTRRMTLSYKFRNTVIATSDKPVAAMTRRREFDTLGFELASAQVAEVIIRPDRYELHQRDDHVRLEYPGLSLSARYLIAADGASSMARKLLFGRSRARHGVSIEADIDIASVCHRDQPRTRADFGIVPGGAAWAFPKRDHFNVGLFTYSNTHASSINRQALQDYARTVLGTDNLTDVRGFPIANNCSSARMSCHRVLFVGDAGGFAYTHNGEGIYGAVLTGQLAAGAVLAGGKVEQRYRHSAARYLRRCALSRMISPPAYATLGLSYNLMAWHLSRQFAGVSRAADDTGRV